MSEAFDAVVVGSGPNGLAAAIELAKNGFSVCVLEAADTIGGGMRTLESTLPGYRHDECSAVHPLGILSPYFRELPLAEHGLEWVGFDASVAHPLDDGPAVCLTRGVEETSADLDPADAAAWERMVRPFLREPHDLLADLLGPIRLRPRRPVQMARFGMGAAWPATRYARRKFRGPRAQALFAGCAAHAVLPLDMLFTAALGLVFAVTAHVETWPCARGGSASIASALESLLRSLGGVTRCSSPVRRLADVPDARVILFDLAPRPFARIASDELPTGYVRRLERYVYGPGSFKLDWALEGPIPWRDSRVNGAATVHVGGTLEEIADSERAAWEGRVHERPYLILCQQSERDETRAPAGKHTGYAYCHVPNGCDEDMTERIEAQVERFAPGFRDRILARNATGPSGFESLNPNYVGGAVTGGAAHLPQLFTRPVARLNPYTTPNPKLFLCSASTPPGGGVHGMCGYHAARAAMRRLRRGS